MRKNKQLVTEFEKTLHHYAALIDAGKLNQVAKLLRHATILDPNKNVLAEGAEQIAQMYKSIIRIYPETGTPKTQHIVSDFKIELETSTQVITSSIFTVWQDLSSGETTVIIKGVYNNIFSQSDQEWVITQHQMSPTKIGDMSEHLLISTLT